MSSKEIVEELKKKFASSHTTSHASEEANRMLTVVVENPDAEDRPTSYIGADLEQEAREALLKVPKESDQVTYVNKDMDAKIEEINKRYKSRSSPQVFQGTSTMMASPTNHIIPALSEDGLSR